MGRDLAIAVLAGQPGSGKSSLADELRARATCSVLRVREALAEVLGGTGKDRAWLQSEGARLDAETSGRWLVDYVRERVEEGGRWVIDSGRTIKQVAPLLADFPQAKLVYLAASESTRRERYALGARTDPLKSGTPFDEAMRHLTEHAVTELEPLAHVILRTDRSDVEGVCSEVIGWLGW